MRMGYGRCELKATLSKVRKQSSGEPVLNATFRWRPQKGTSKKCISGSFLDQEEDISLAWEHPCLSHDFTSARSERQHVVYKSLFWHFFTFFITHPSFPKITERAFDVLCGSEFGTLDGHSAGAASNLPHEVPMLCALVKGGIQYEHARPRFIWRINDWERRENARFHFVEKQLNVPAIMGENNDKNILRMFLGGEEGKNRQRRGKCHPRVSEMNTTPPSQYFCSSHESIHSSSLCVEHRSFAHRI